MYAEDFLAVFWVVVIIGIAALLISLGFKADKRSQLHDQKMRSDFVQCQKDHKDWVFKYKTGLDGICVTKQ